MMNMIKLLGVGAVLFGISYAASSYLLVKTPGNPDEAGDLPRLAEEDSAVTAGGFSIAAAEIEGEKEQAAGIEKVDAMPVGLPDEKSLSIEAVLQLSESIRKKEAQLVHRESVIAREEERLKMIFGDIQREQKELIALGDSVDSRIMAARELLEKIQAEKNGLAELKKTAAPASSGGSARANEADPRVAQASGWLKSLDAEQAAKYLKEFANQGEMQFAAEVLNSLDDRQASKILAALNDTVLGTQLINAAKK